ncbi:MAG: hypothetical protein RDU25_03270 [Patescibacteria group bacterium]|nr:hypothetical protein [Patescibacteria group bacterium]
MKKIHITAVLLAALVYFYNTAEPALAKELIFKSGSLDTPAEAYVIRRPTSAATFFGRLQSKDDVDYFSFTADEGTSLKISLDTVKNDGEFNPIMIFFGPELPSPSEDAVIDLGSGNGAIVRRVVADERASFRDKFIFTDFYSGPTIEIELPKTATYGLAVKSPNGKLGRYALNIQGEDKLALADLPEYLYNIIKAIFRMY